MDNLRMRSIFAVLGLALAIMWVAPNTINLDKIWWPSKQKLNYGLDIQGGLHLVMSADIPGVIKEGSQRLVGSMKAEFIKDNIPVEDIKVTEGAQGDFEVILANPADKAKAEEMINNRHSAALQKIGETDKAVTYRYYESYLHDLKSKVVQQAIETIRNRIDEFGVAEPSISQQGDDRILVQLPGMADAERAKQLINTAAKLDFMMVEEEPKIDTLAAMIADAEKAGGYNIGKLKYSEYISRLNKDLTGKLPEKTMILFEKAPNAANMEAGKIPYLVRTDTNLGGEGLSDAFVSFGQYGAPEVGIHFNAMGTAVFRDLTAANVGKRMAIVLDKVVKTAPVIKTQIGNGEARIELNGKRNDQSLNEAKMIATALRAGALPAALEQLEERRVGPSLGADSIQKAHRAAWIGAILIIIFMLIRYKGMGVVSNISLAVNILAVFALLTSLGATLTLPGIAGIALTVGFAVDANVLINERMREELRKGSSFTLAVKEGYSRAMSAILDANVTTAAVAGVLLYFGTGPVRGFAVTMLIGVVTTLFANVFVSKVMIDNLIHRFGVKKISV
ncbi:MAG: protein translocase subunit SecD [Bdellovibrio sp.]|nr:MAG: protein translocase subunit SecD [Bdellovibrio sp.]